MPCNECPENVPVLQGPISIVYTGGPPAAPFAAVGLALPQPDEKIVTLYGLPTVSREGVISYSKGGPQPPVPTGYKAEDPWTFRPVWPSCQHRLLEVHPVEDGSLIIHGYCLNHQAGRRDTERLSVEVCRGCPQIRPIK